MNFEKIKELKNYLDKNDYYTNYISVQKGLYFFSFIAQAAIIFFGFYYISDVIRTAEPELNPYLISSIAFIFLFGFELLKRSVTDKWAKDAVENGLGAVRAGLLILTTASLIMYAGSFYFTLSGAGKWSDRSEKIKDATIVNVVSVKDSLAKKYDTRIDLVKTERQKLEELINANPNVINYNTAVKKLTDRGWRTDKQLVESLKPAYETASNRFNDNIKKLDNQITTIETEKDKEQKSAEERLTDKSVVDSKESKVAQSSFIKWSIGFEFIVILGILFRRYFQRKSVTDWEERVKSDPRLNRWYRYDKLLDILYQTKIKTLDAGAPMPIAKDLSKMATMDGLLFTDSEINGEYYKLLNQLGIIVTRGSKRYIQLGYSEAKKCLGKQFEIN
jgi:hypothetical protein